MGIDQSGQVKCQHGKNQDEERALKKMNKHPSLTATHFSLKKYMKAKSRLSTQLLSYT